MGGDSQGGGKRRTGEGGGGAGRRRAGSPYLRRCAAGVVRTVLCEVAKDGLQRTLCVHLSRDTPQHQLLTPATTAHSSLYRWRQASPGARNST